MIYLVKILVFYSHVSLPDGKYHAKPFISNCQTLPVLMVKFHASPGLPMRQADQCEPGDDSCSDLSLRQLRVEKLKTLQEDEEGRKSSHVIT